MEWILLFVGIIVGFSFGVLLTTPKEKELWELKDQIKKLTEANEKLTLQNLTTEKINTTTAEYNKSLNTAIVDKTKRKLQLEKDILAAETELNALNELLAERKKEFFDEWSKSKDDELEDNSKD